MQRVLRQIHETIIKHMKTSNQRYVILALSLVALALGGCEHNISTGTTVHADGSLDREIILHNTDSAKADKNIMGIRSENGWEVTVGPPSRPSREKDKKSEVNISFKKHFSSAGDANREMDPDIDSVFRIKSSFEKHNRWFYTYIEYRDTYEALNLFKRIPKEEYFTKEDFAFIERLPAEGTVISKADSLYLARLNEKIFDFYGSRTIFEEFYQHLLTTVRQHRIAPQWEDSLKRKKEVIYQRFMNEGNLKDEDFVAIVDEMNIPLPAAGREAIVRKTAEIEKRLEFLSEAYSGKYVHTIEMPWTVVESNADSVSTNRLFWRPPVVKFLLSDYTMSARSRKMNPWAVGISALVVVVTVGLFFVRKK